MKQERDLFQKGRHQEDSRLTSQDCLQSAKNTSGFLQGKCGTKVRGHLQVGNKDQVYHCLGVNCRGGLAGSGRSLLEQCLSGNFGSHQGMLCLQALLPVFRDKLERLESIRKFEVKMEVVEILFQKGHNWDNSKI